jgi:hypothetical protein
MATPTTDPADLITAQDLTTFLQTPGGPQEIGEIAQSLITSASLICEEYTGRRLKYRQFTSIRMAGRNSPKLYLGAFPIDTTKVVTVSVDGDAQTVWRTESDGDPSTFEVVVGTDDPMDHRCGVANHLWRWASWDSGLQSSQWDPDAAFSFPQQPYTLLLSFWAGYGGGGLYPNVPEDLKLACKYVAQQIHRDSTKSETVATSKSSRVGGGVTLLVDEIPMKAAAILNRYKLPAFPMARA